MSFRYSLAYIFAVLAFAEGSIFGYDYTVSITTDSPVVIGGTVHFTAKVFDSSKRPASGSFLYEWKDNAIPDNKATHESQSPIDTWNVTYSSVLYPSGIYEVQVIVKKYIFFIYEEVTSQRELFYLTRNLNGHMELTQANKTINTVFVANSQPLVHRIVLNKPDAEYLNTSATSVLTYWFVDCIYYGPTNDYTFTFHYTEAGKQHNVEALTIASYDPIPTTPPPTTTPVPNNTTTSAPNGTTTTTVKPNDKTNATTTERTSTIKSVTDKSGTDLSLVPKLMLQSTGNEKNAIQGVQKVLINDTGKLVPYSGSMNFPYVCANTVAPDNHKTYGFFSRNFTIKAPVSNVTVTGNNWLQHGDMLSLRVKCNGSEMFSYCVHWPKGHYNVTGNETCLNPDTSEKCEFPIRHYFKDPEVYTVVIVIYNDVGKVVSPVTVTVYKVNKQAQLSVIIVPVTFSLVAVVLIVFGVAYYLQNRSRFIVEVADFNFSRQYTDMEYKTFTERLRESISNALTRAPTPSSSEHSVWPPGQKYGSL